jgi:hypothetical protein
MQLKVLMEKYVIIINDDSRRIWKARSWPTLRCTYGICLMGLKETVIGSGRTANILTKI